MTPQTLRYDSFNGSNYTKDTHGKGSNQIHPRHSSPVGSSGMMMIGPPPSLGSFSIGSLAGHPSMSAHQQNLVSQEMGNLQQQLTNLHSQTHMFGGIPQPSSTLTMMNVRTNTTDTGSFLSNLEDEDEFSSGVVTVQQQLQQQQQQLQQQQLLAFQSQQLLHHAAGATTSAQPTLSMMGQSLNFPLGFFPPPHSSGSTNMFNSPSVFFNSNTMINPNAFGSTSFQDEKALSYFDAVGGSGSPSLEPNSLTDMFSNKGWDVQLSGRKPRTLYMPCDDESLSEYQCLVRKQIEIFEAGFAEVESNAKGRNKPIVLGQVGIRCRHCSKVAPKERKKGAMYYPAKLSGLYQAAQSLASGHLCAHCNDIPPGIRQELMILKEKKSSAGGGKDYWGEGVRILGVYEDEDGLRFQNGMS